MTEHRLIFLPQKELTRYKMLAGVKQSSLLCKLVNYVSRKMYCIGHNRPGGVDIFVMRSKLFSAVNVLNLFLYLGK
jgi:hypothetical protein